MYMINQIFHKATQDRKRVQNEPLNPIISNYRVPCCRDKKNSSRNFSL